MDKERRAKLIGGLLVALPSLALTLLLEPVLQNGDAAVYNERVDERHLGERTVHIGYVALGIVFRTLLPGPTDLVMNAMTVVLGLVGQLAVYASALRASRSPLASAAAALALLAVPAYLRGMLLSEVDVPLAALVALAFALFVYGRPAWAGAAFGAALLVSPLAVCGLPMLLAAGLLPHEPALDWRQRALRFARFAAVAALVYVPPVAYHWREYLYGGRGLLRVPAPFDWPKQLKLSTLFMQASWLLLIPVLVGGAAAIAKRMGVLVAGGALTALLALALDRFNDVPAQLPTAVLVAPWIALAIALAGRWQRLAPALACLALIASLAATGLARVRGQIAGLASERDAYTTLAQSSGGRVYMVGARNFTQARRFERTVYGRSYTGHVITRRDVRENCAKLGRSGAYLWFARGSPYLPCFTMRKRYEESAVELGGVSYRLLVPRARYARR